MSNPLMVRVAQRGVLTLPKSLRETYDLKTGDTLSLMDLGGVFVLSPRRSEVDMLAEKVTQELIRGGETLESMLQALREERDRYTNED